MDGENKDLEKGAVDGPVKGNGYYTSDMHPIPSGASNQSMSSVVRFTGDGDIETGSEFFNKLYRRCPFLMYNDFLLRFWVYFDTAPHGVAFVSVFGFFVGAMWFMVGTWGSASKSIYAQAVPGDCGNDAYGWFAYFCYLVGDVTWFVACYCQMCEAVNHGYEEEMERWRLGGSVGKKPRYKWIPIGFTNLEWWSAFAYWFGVGMYIEAACMAYVAACYTNLNIYVYLWLVDYTYVGAGILFLLAGTGYCAVLVSPWIIPAIIVPFKKEYWTSMLWWGTWIYFWGGVMFFMSGLFLYWDSPINYAISYNTYLWENCWGFGFGAFCFWVGAWLFLARQSRGRCRPSLVMIESNVDPTVRKGDKFKPLSASEHPHPRPPGIDADKV